MGVVCSLLVCGGKGKQNKTVFFFSPPFLFFNQNICQPNMNWQHSFKKQNRPCPSWALTKLLYLCLTCRAHVLPSLPGCQQHRAFPCPSGTLTAQPCSPCAPVAHSWARLRCSSAPRLAPAPSSYRTHVRPFLRPSELRGKVGNRLSPFLKGILRELHGLYWAFTNQSFFTLASVRNRKIYNKTKKHSQSHSDCIASSLGNIIRMSLLGSQGSQFTDMKKDLFCFFSSWIPSSYPDSPLKQTPPLLKHAFLLFCAASILLVLNSPCGLRLATKSDSHRVDLKCPAPVLM